MNYITKKTSLVAIFIAILSVAVFAAAANYSLFGDAELVNPGNNSPTAAQLRSAATGDGFGGADFTITSGLTFADITKSRELLGYNPTTKIADGIPRFVEWFRANE